MDDGLRHEILDGQSLADEILPRRGFQLAAIDYLEPFAARFHFRVDEGGDFDFDTEIVRRDDRDRWDPIVAGGSYNSGWDLPWIPPIDGWPFGHLWVLGLCGLDVAEDDGDRELIAVYGFASGASDAIRVHTERTSRSIAPTRTGAFVALATGNGYQFVELTPYRADVALSAAVALPNPP